MPDDGPGDRHPADERHVLYQLHEEYAAVSYTHLDTDSELAFGLENEGRPPEEIRLRVAETVKALQLQGLTGRSIFSLSGGQKQLLAFGSVYAMGPEIFVLDEPTANLDQAAIARLHDQIAALKREGRTVIIAEHRLYFLTDLIDRALYLRGGVLERAFSREEFCAMPEGEREALGPVSYTHLDLGRPGISDDYDFVPG